MAAIVVNPAAKDEYFEVSEVEEIPCPNISDGDEEFANEPDTIRKWQFKLSKRKKQAIKVKSRIRSAQLVLEEQDEQLKNLQEQIAKKLFVSKTKPFDWTGVKAAHLISKVFENCEPVVVDNPEMKQNGDDPTAAKDPNRSAQDGSTEPNVKEDETNTNEEVTADTPAEKSSPAEKTKCLYTADFHRFAIALYFFSPKAYFFLSNVAPMFPHRNYIRQWVTAGRVEKLFPRGVFREEFNE